MGKLSAAQIRALTKSGRYMDGDGLSLLLGVSEETTVFVGANNSGKTSAMLALRYFLVERERSRFSMNDFTLSHWPAIDAMGASWEEAKASDQELPASATILAARIGS